LEFVNFNPCKLAKIVKNATATHGKVAKDCSEGKNHRFAYLSTTEAFDFDLFSKKAEVGISLVLVQILVDGITCF
jgi:hypothetical protein